MNVVAPIETGHAVQSATETKTKRMRQAGIVMYGQNMHL